MRIVNEACVLDLLTSLDREKCLGLLAQLHKALIACSAEQASLESADTQAVQRIFQPLRTNITTANNDITLVMPASNTELTSIKVLTAPHSGNLTAMLSFFDPEGTPLGIISATTITPFRTALTVMILFTKYTGSKRKLVMFGAGRQVEWHARLAVILHPGAIDEIVIVARKPAKAEALANRLDNLHGSTKFVAHGLRDVDAKLLRSADAIFTCTPSTEPLFSYDLLDASRHYFISLIGSYVPSMHEIDGPTLMSAYAEPGAKVFVDSREAALEESGELIDAHIKPDDLVEIGELGLDAEIRVPAKGNVVLKAVGLGIMDLTTGKAILDLAGDGVDVEW